MVLGRGDWRSLSFWLHSMRSLKVDPMLYALPEDAAHLHQRKEVSERALLPKGSGGKSAHGAPGTAGFSQLCCRSQT